MEVTATITLYVEAQCEACGRGYDYYITLANPATIEKGGVIHLVNNLDPDLMKMIEGGQFGFRRCPKCGYLQSWMVKEWRRAREQKLAFVLSFPFFILIVKLIGHPWPAPKTQIIDINTWGIWGLSLLGYVALLVATAFPFIYVARRLLKNPNRNWHIINGPRVPTTRLPRVHPEA
jgi:hypothetical protein